jgi:predicted permease
MGDLVGTVREWLHRLWAIFSKYRHDDDLEEELRLHLELAVEDARRHGNSASHAARVARIEAGGSLQAMEALRDQRGLPVFEDLIRDVRHGLRTLRRSPVFTVVCVLTLALGIGANTALFSVVDSVLLRPLPFPEPDRLVRLFDTNTRREERNQVSPADLADWQRRQRSFTGVAGWSCQGFALATTPPEQVEGRCVSTNYFDLLGVPLLLGRAFRLEEGTIGQQHVVILSYGLWQSHFNGDAGVIGRDATLNGEKYTVVGVLPRGFEAVDQFGLQEPVQLFVPLAFTQDDLTDRGSHNFNLIARLRPGVSLPQAQADMDSVTATLATIYPNDNTGRGVLVTSLNQEVVRDVRTSLLVLFAAVILILLLACANVANLMLTRAVGQQREVAVRIALGAGRLRIMRGFIAQNLVLALIGGAVGMLLAYWGLWALRPLAPTSLPRLDQIALNGRVLAFTLTISIVAGVLFGLVPALHVSAIRPYDSLERRGLGNGGAVVLRWRDLLMIGEVALSLILLLTAGLLLKSFGLLQGVGLGYQPDRVIAVRMFLPRAKYPQPAARIAFYDRVVERVVGLPGVEFTAFASNLPLRGGWGGNLTLEDAPDPAHPDYQASFQLVSPDYFRALAVPLREGRLFTSDDRSGTLPVVIVNETTARRFWPKGNAVGSRLKKGGPISMSPWRTVLGVVGDVRLWGPESPAPLEVYFPSGQYENLGISPSELVARTASEAKRSNSSALNRGCATESVTLWPSVSTRLSGCSGSILQIARRMAGTSSRGSPAVRATSSLGEMPRLSYCPAGKYTSSGIGLAGPHR